MSDPLAEAIAAVIETEHRWRSAPLMLGVESRTCTCGATFATTAEHHIHVYEQAAATARAFIGDEIHERCNWVDGTGELDDGEVYQKWGIEQAESIARGDTT